MHDTWHEAMVDVVEVGDGPGGLGGWRAACPIMMQQAQGTPQLADK